MPGRILAQYNLVTDAYVFYYLQYVIRCGVEYIPPQINFFYQNVIKRFMFRRTVFYDISGKIYKRKVCNFSYTTALHNLRSRVMKCRGEYAALLLSTGLLVLI